MTLGRRGRRWLTAASVFAFVFLLGAWWINRQLEPSRLTALVLDKAGESFGLQFAFAGQPDYAFKPEPRLLIPNLTVRSPVDGKVFLSAQRAEVSLPWDTLTGGEPVITRIELEAPILDLAGLRRWQATRPATPFELPTLTKGLNIRDGLVRDEAYTLSKLNLDLPRLKSNEPASMTASGVFRQGNTSVAFSCAMTAATPGLASDFTLSGSGELLQSPKPLPFKVAANGHYLSEGPVFSLEAASLRFQGTSPLPSLDGKLALRITEPLALTFKGTLLEWAKDWPALPQPLSANAQPIPLFVEYVGNSDFSDPLTLDLTPPDTRIHAGLRIQDIQQWLKASDAAPLPPLNATMTTPKLEIEGMVLEGVEIEIREDAAIEPKP